MKFLRTAVLLFAVLAADVAAQSALAGHWRTVVVAGQPRDRMPKMFGEVLLDLKADGTTLTGTATMGDGWPGSAPIQDAKIDGNRFSFTWTGTIASSGGVPITSRYPRLTFTGTVDGDEMKLSMDGDYKMDLKGERLPPK
jgi:hypothetical protein